MDYGIYTKETDQAAATDLDGTLASRSIGSRLPHQQHNVQVIFVWSDWQNNRALEKKKIVINEYTYQGTTKNIVPAKKYNVIIIGRWQN